MKAVPYDLALIVHENEVAEAKSQDAVRDLPGLASSNGVLASVGMARVVSTGKHFDRPTARNSSLWLLISV
jgi:hypothetical protein